MDKSNPTKVSRRSLFVTLGSLLFARNSSALSSVIHEDPKQSDLLLGRDGKLVRILGNGKNTIRGVQKKVDDTDLRSWIK